MGDVRWLLASLGLCAALACGRVGFDQLSGNAPAAGDDASSPSPTPDAGTGSPTADADTSSPDGGGSSQTCTDSCTCPAGDTCRFVCADICAVDCERGSTCDVLCKGPTCNLNCGTDADCNLDCATGNCTVLCTDVGGSCSCTESGGVCGPQLPPPRIVAPRR